MFVESIFELIDGNGANDVSGECVPVWNDSIQEKMFSLVAVFDIFFVYSVCRASQIAGRTSLVQIVCCSVFLLPGDNVVTIFNFEILNEVTTYPSGFKGGEV